MEVYVITKNGAIENTVFVDLKGASDYLGMNYNSVRNKPIRNGKRTFNGKVIIQQCNVVGSGRVGNRLKFDKDKWKEAKKHGNILDIEEQRMEDWNRNKDDYTEA